jgi:hypothetical protein
MRQLVAWPARGRRAILTRMSMRRAGPLAVAALMSFAGAGARAQTRACPPCGPNDRCVDGVCLPPAEAPPAIAAPPVIAPPAEPLPPPAPPAAPSAAEPEPAPEVKPPPPPPRPRQQAKPRRPARHEKKRDDESDDDDDDDDAPTWHKGLLLLPFVGLHAVEGIASSDYDAGLRLGGLLGTRVTPAVSLNVELAFNFLNPNRVNGTSTTQASGHDFTIAFSPLFHGSSNLGELVVGPKLGYWSSGITTPGQGGSELQFSQAGWAFGFNVGAFAGLNDTVALGALLAYQMTFLAQSCSRGATVPIQGCTSDDFAPQILSFSIAALF